MRTVAKNAWRLEFGFGIELDQSGKRISKKRQAVALKAIRRLATKLYGGCTLVETVGDWLDPKTGLLHSETGRTLIVYVEGDFSKVEYRARKETIVQAIKVGLKQAAVAFCLSEVRFKIL